MPHEEEKESVHQVDRHEYEHQGHDHVWSGELHLLPFEFKRDALTFSGEVNDLDNYIIDFIIDGTGEKVTSRGCTRVLPGGDIMWLEKGLAHDFKASKRQTVQLPIHDTRRATKLRIKVREEKQQYGKCIF